MHAHMLASMEFVSVDMIYCFNTKVGNFPSRITSSTVEAIERPPPVPRSTTKPQPMRSTNTPCAHVAIALPPKNPNAKRLKTTRTHA